jgi:choline dehydrogenase
MSDIMTQDSATSYADLVLADLTKTTSDVTGWLSLPANVAKGMRAQYEIMQKWLTGNVGQLEILLTMLGE